ARAYTAAHEIFSIHDLWTEIESLDNKAAAQSQMAMMIDTGGLIERVTLWLLRNRRPPLDIASTVAYFQSGVRELADSLPKPLAAENRLTVKQRHKHFSSEGVPQELAARIAGLVALSSALDIVEVAKGAKREVPFVAALYFDLGARLELQWLREQIAALKTPNHWHTLGKSALRNDVHIQQRNLTADVLRNGRGAMRPKALVDSWVTANQLVVDRFMERMSDLKASDTVDFAMLSVALSEVHGLLEGNAPVAQAPASAA
ncbi:MAG: NAD-glutamate dehydrogenase, partial [Acidobacteriota bacterium]